MLRSRIYCFCVLVIVGFIDLSRVQASLTIDLRIRAINGQPAPNTKWAPAYNSPVTIDVFADVRGQNNTSTFDGLQSIQGSLVASSAPGGVCERGPFARFVPAGDDITDNNGDPTGQKLFAVSPFTDSGTTNGTEQDLNPKDGNLDFGGEPTDLPGIGDFIGIRAATAQMTGGTILPGIPGVLGAGREFKIASFDYTFSKDPNAITQINWRPRLLTNGAIAASAGLWTEDARNGTKDGATSTIFVGQPVTLGPLDVTCPEPECFWCTFLLAGAMSRRFRCRYC